jgi:hypothetical protein
MELDLTGMTHPPRAKGLKILSTVPIKFIGRQKLLPKQAGAPKFKLGGCFDITACGTSYLYQKTVFFPLF